MKLPNRTLVFTISEKTVKPSKKGGHCLFVEEESYDWAPIRTGASKSLLVLSTLLFISMVIFLTLSR